MRYTITTLERTFDVVDAPRPCCMRRARARYWLIARGYLACGVVLGLALGMVLGAASKVCP